MTSTSRNHAFERSPVDAVGQGRLKEYVVAVMAQKTQEQRFQRRTSIYQKHNLLEHIKKKSWCGPPSETIYGGLSASAAEDDIGIALAVRDTTYFLDFAEQHFPRDETSNAAEMITDFVIDQVRKYKIEHLEKFIGIALPINLAVHCPRLCPRLWAELDIVPLVLHGKGVHSVGWINTELWNSKMLDEQAESIARKCITTPQGGGVALMRHALVRFSEALGTDIKWYVPRPKPGVFRITKTNHNILQGVARLDERLTEENKKQLTDWIATNAKRYWFGKGGPLDPPEKGGADIIVIDDPQMPGLIPLIKAATPNRPVIYRSHIQIRSDLVDDPSTPQAEAWAYFWESIKQADLFISHPVSAFVPSTVNPESVGYLPASTDWLDGLNKNMEDWDVGFYGRVFNAKCREIGMTTIDYPKDEYIVQVARFDPSKGIFDVIQSYAKFFDKIKSETTPPKLLICGHGSVDDPDGAVIYDAVIEYLECQMRHLKPFICVMHIPPSDQILNAVLSKARIALQLSVREGFEVKVSEALHKGKPVIATLAGGIPLQVQHGKNGFLVEVGDTDAVAQHLYDLWTDDELYDRMSEYALTSVSDEVSTVGNALSWLYLASQMTKGKSCKPHGRWINDMAREAAGKPYLAGENRLKREVDVKPAGTLED
ncbi:trehalose synthase [Coccidioides immitis RMSCC 3703]|uniref:Trehalose synthase n=1 Tax=Coccidioides immitis RMSCC 3703 TaxID=454286 RepID=A0A0J8TJN5_COCIT|nr:trehalose synthase [Coccidioides immitis RMSCC 3703]